MPRERDTGRIGESEHIKSINKARKTVTSYSMARERESELDSLTKESKAFSSLSVLNHPTRLGCAPGVSHSLSTRRIDFQLIT